MRRILVPLDGSDLATSILPDARRMAGPDGQLILIQSVHRPEYDPERDGWSEGFALDVAQKYLEGEAESLRSDGVQVEAHALYILDTVLAIDEAAKFYQADMVASATHGRGPLGRLVRGSVAWKALAHSTVPVLLRHADGEVEDFLPPRLRRVMVPLDGSAYAEQALPLAHELAREWNASLWLVQVVPAVTVPPMPYPYIDESSSDRRMEVQEARDYLDRIVLSLGGDVHTQVLVGRVTGQLASATDEYAITDVVMASHGRTGLSRAILGSVADSLIQHLYLPIVVVPALAARSMRQREQVEEVVTRAGSASS
jgi:nucleotide-binding universal stress UspA family protein